MNHPISNDSVGENNQSGVSAVAARPDVHEIVAARLQTDGQRYTTNRRRLVDVLTRAGRPLSIPEILAANPRLPVSSAYRNLVVLEHAGAVGRMLASEGARYELAEGLLAHHHHLVCLSCGVVADVTLSARSERAIDAASNEVAAATGLERWATASTSSGPALAAPPTVELTPRASL